MSLSVDLKLPPSATVLDTATTIKIARVGAFAIKNHAIMQVVGPAGSGKTVGVWSWHFAWVAPVVFLGYAWTAPIPVRRPVGENAPPAGVIPSGFQVS